MNRQQIEAEAYHRAANGEAFSNYPAIFAGFIAKGIAEADISPRENVLTYHAWKHRGRQVLKGERGVKVSTWIPIKDKDTGEIEGKAPRIATVFHVSQTKEAAL